MLRHITDNLIIDVDRIVYVTHDEQTFRTNFCVGVGGEESVIIAEVDPHKAVFNEFKQRNSK
jgi:hypothetical protein